MQTPDDQHPGGFCAFRYAFARTCRWLVCLTSLLPITAPAAIRANFDELLRELPPLKRHTNQLAPREQGANEAYEHFIREKLSAQWFAVLVRDSTPPSFTILRRFESWNRFMDFLQASDAIVDVWACNPTDSSGRRRLAADEINAMRKNRMERPTFLTITYQEPGRGIVVTNRVEFGLNAAKTALSANQSYLRHRQLQQKARAILSARDGEGNLTAQAQWESLSAAVRDGELAVELFPDQPGKPGDLFIAFEYALDEFGNFSRIIQAYRESDLQHRVIRSADGGSAQVVALKKNGQPRHARGFRRLAAGGSLIPAPNPIQGQDDVELRVENADEPDPEKWNMLDFGEPELIRRSALAKFSLISAYLERQRKQTAWKKSTIDLIAEPIFLGLNIGGGVTGVPVPLGEAARLAYNTTIVPQFIPDVPSVKQLRELMLLLAARERHPEIKTKPQRFLNAGDIRILREEMGRISEKEFQEFVQRVSDDDLKAMLQLARLQRIDSQVSNLLAILADAAKVSGASDTGLLRDILSSPYFSVTGDISIKTLIAVAAGGNVATPLSGVSLETLSQGRGPGAAWLQYLNLTVDIRAVMNTAHRLTHASLADKELKKPFPYAPRLSDLAAYEIRLFGYPLLIWYKRGLLKDDIGAFDHDYAYGLLGARIVEHFATREQMDAEIRAGAMIPLGYVLIPDKKLGWRESNLAVFAHKIRSGKYQGKTTIIIYGLKAYHENSELIEREYRRYKQFERLAIEGGVIEQTVRAEKGQPMQAQDFEPRFHVGVEAGEQIYAPLLALLTEWHRVVQRYALSLTVDREAAATIQKQLESYGVQTFDPAFDEPLLALDRHNSSFIYRKHGDGGRWKTIRLISVPGIDELRRDLAKAEEAAEIEKARRESLSQGHGVVLINRADAVGDHYEVGPLFTNSTGHLAGLWSGSNVLGQFFARVDDLPLADRSRLELNNFASTLLEMDVDGDSKPEKVFVTVEFPPVGQSRRYATNRLTGLPEQSVFTNGRLKSSASAKWILELEQSEQGEELASKLFANEGTLGEPRQGVLIEETKTLEFWPRPARGAIDPYEPAIRKLRFNYVTGEMRSETYGLFHLPIETATAEFVTTNKFDAYGRLSSSHVFENGETESEFNRPLLARIVTPIRGEQRRQLITRSTEGARMIQVEEKDLVKGASKFIDFDPTHLGRKSVERFTDSVNGQSIQSEARFEYKEDFYHGLIPTFAVLRDPLTGTELSRVETKAFDPWSRRLVAEELSYTGAAATKLWDYRWNDPIASESALRRTTNSFDRRGLSFSSITTSATAGETVSVSVGRFEPVSHQWMITNDYLLAPGVTNRTETQFRTAFGTLIATRAAANLEVRPIYDLSGIPRTNQTVLFNDATKEFDRVHRLESDFTWNRGARRARVDTCVDGKLHASFYALSDSTGRTVTNGITRIAGLDLYTVSTFDGESERLLKTQEYQGGTVRTTRIVQAARHDNAGRTILPITIVPSWGLAATQTFLLGEPYGRPLSTVYEDGKSVRVVDWFEGTAIPHIAEIVDRHGKVTERAVSTVQAHKHEGLLLDGVARYAVGYSGSSGRLVEEARIAGADIMVFSEARGERTYFDLRKPYSSPIYATDLLERDGVTAFLNGSNRSHVVSLFASALLLPGGNTNAAYSEPVMSVRSLDLRSLFFHKISEQVQDRAGSILQIQIGHVPFPGEAGHSQEALSNLSWNPKRGFRYFYEPGSVVEDVAAASNRTWRFSATDRSTASPRFSVNDGPWREFVTKIEAIETPETSDVQTVPQYTFRRIHSPREIERNPCMPGNSNVWRSWTATELGINGQRLFDNEMIYDAQGNLCVTRSSKTTSAGEPAFKLAYTLDAAHARAAVAELAPGGAAKPVSLKLAAGSFPIDLSGSDFIYCIINSPSTFSVTIRDTRGRTVEAVRGPPDPSRGVIQFHGMNRTFARWLPDTQIPTQGITIDELRGTASNDLAVISIHELARAGLHIQQVSAVEVNDRSPTKTIIKASPVYQLVRGSPWVADERTIGSIQQSERHSSGITTFTAAELRRQPRHIYSGQKMSASAEYNGLPIAVSYPRFKHWDFPYLVLMDYSDSDAPRPLYAISPKDGHFLEHYKTLKLGDAQVYTVVRGFDLPHLDVFRAGILDDELGPGYVAYGDDYQVSLEYDRGRGAFGHAAATLQNRIAANAFRYAGQRLLSRMGSDMAVERLSHLNYQSIHDAHAQAREIDGLPMLAQTLLPGRTLPWDQSSSSQSPEIDHDWRRFQFRLGKLHLEYPTGLIPTAPETAVQRYVETAREADLVALNVGLAEFAVAREILDFYWDKSKGGQLPLHSYYDAESGTAMRADVMFERPMHARRTALAQLAIADAAFQLGLATSDPKWLTFGRNLLQVVLDRFRENEVMRGKPRGIADYEPIAVRRPYGLAFWPEADTYSLQNNARACLLLKELSALMPRFNDPAWAAQITAALHEQERWLRLYIFPRAERTGVVPNGVFEIQDVHRETTALTPECWTSAEDWLFFLQAARQMGVPRQTLHRWLENLARLHGVNIRGTWGLDPAIAVLRPDAISSDLTAQFWRTAKLLEHKSAESFALQSLARLRNGTNYAAVLTAAAPDNALPSGQNGTLYPATNQQSWAPSLAIYRHLKSGPGWDLSHAPPQLQTRPVSEVWEPQRTDITFFGVLAIGFYASILVVALFWWRFRALREAEHAKVVPELLVPQTVMQLVEERWANRILGLQIPKDSEHTRFSNAPLEQNFLMQLRAIYKLIIEWRRQENGWAEDDRRVVDDESDEWINGADEFVTVIGLYMRWVIKAGAKDGFDHHDVLLENEDSNHIWSRLVMYLGEFYWGLLGVVRSYNNFVTPQDKAFLSPEIARLLTTIGVRQRLEPFDARVLFNFPDNPAVMDLLIIQKPGMTLDKLTGEMSVRLRTPYLHIIHIIERYKNFKRRERPYPLHPYTLEFAKVLPHFLIMGLGALVWHNYTIGDSPIIPYLWSVISHAALSPLSLTWAIPIFLGILGSGLAAFTRVYRWDAPMLARDKSELILDATLTSLFVKSHSTMPKLRRGRRWNPAIYERGAWLLRTIGFLVLGIALLRLETPSFAIFLVVKGLLAMLAFAEVAAVAVPIAFSWFSKAVQDAAASQRKFPRLFGSLNKLNITAVRPASPVALSLRYHFQPSVPSGNFGSMAQALLFYFVLAALFFFIGAYLCQQIFSLWFTDTYLNASNWKLFFGGLLFWNTMYLLRYGLFVLFTGFASALVAFPLKASFALLALGCVVAASVHPPLAAQIANYPSIGYTVLALGLAAAFLEQPICKWFKSLRRERKTPAPSPANGDASLGIVYMSGDDLSHLKLTVDLLMTRWMLLRDKLSSSAVSLLQNITSAPDDETLKKDFHDLYEAEKRAQCTLWVPSQLVVPDEAAVFSPELGLNIPVESEAERERLLGAWHIRRWLVSMMSTAGHSQDTAVNLVDMALRLQEEGLAARLVFYLIQNKYDNNDTNRPSQIAYDQGELAHRNKLSRLLTSIAPGARAYSLQNWTPFGFKAGGLMAMDLAHEETLRLGTLVLLDRNATVNDLDAFARDVRRALADPELIIIVPGRSTTNTLTSIGQGSQMVEEGHRSFLKGLMGLLGGGASEAVGTGWGNIITASYGRVQAALLDSHSLKMPLTSRMWRGSSFAVRTEGLIGFALHAVGISEDTWAVAQATHNAIGMGKRVKYGVSEAIWHKIRETWSHSEWLASFPRWSGGYLQMMQDPIMQRINDLGPKSVFAKEIRANSGRNFLMAPFALLNILMMPLAIMLDITPFVQILLVLWNFGFIMNQILTIHALNTYLESSGFYAIPAVLGGLAGGIVSFRHPSLAPLAPAVILLSALAGGFIVGLSRWVFTRVRDLVLFGPQLVLHALGQLLRQSLEFVVSGASPEDAKSVNMAFRTWAGPREDRPLDGFSSSMNLKTVIWVFGLASLVLNLFALLNLDLLNVLLLLPSLLFTVSILAGPYLLKPRVGRSAGSLAFIPRALGWVASISIYTLVSLWLPERGVAHWAALALLGAVFLLLLYSGLRYSTHRFQLRRRTRALARLLRDAGADDPELASALVIQAGANPAKAPAILERRKIDATRHDTIVAFLDQKLKPLLQKPVVDVRDSWSANNRWLSEFNRSFVFSLLVLLWLFVVPVPGLFVFRAGDYRVSFGLLNTILFIFAVIGIALLAAWIGGLIQWFDSVGTGKRSLRQRISRAFAEFQQRIRSPHLLSSTEISSIFALFTDIQVYMDQRSYAYAHRLLSAIESTLASKRGEPQG